MSKLMLLGFCLFVSLFITGCQKEEVSPRVISQKIEEATWNFNRGFYRFTVKQIKFQDGVMTLSHDINFDGEIDYRWPHKYQIVRNFHNTYLHIQPTGKTYYEEWCRFELRDELMYLYFEKGEVLFTIDTN